MEVNFFAPSMGVSFASNSILRTDGRDLFDISAPNITLLPVKDGDNWKLYTYICFTAAKRSCVMLQYDWEQENNRVRVCTFFGWLATDQEKLVNGKMKLFSMMSNSSPDVTIDHNDSITEVIPTQTNTSYLLWQNIGMGSYDNASRYTRKAIVFYKDNGEVEKVCYSATLEVHRSGTSCTFTIHRNEANRDCLCEMYITKDRLGEDIKGEHIAWRGYAESFAFVGTIWSGTTGVTTPEVDRCQIIRPGQIDAAHCLRVCSRAGDVWFLGEPTYLTWS